MSYTLLILISLISGCLIFIPGLRSKKNFHQILSFSGSFLLSICLLHMLPELFSSDLNEAGLYLLAGFFLQLILDYFSGGIEHGHTHVSKKQIGHFPFLVFFSLCLHAFLEALPIDHFVHHKEENALLYGLLVHKAPISFILASLLTAYQLKSWLILLGILIFSLSAPFGAWVGSELLSDGKIFQQMLALSAGIILHLSTTILLENNEEHTIQWKKLLPMLVGAALASLTVI